RHVGELGLDVPQRHVDGSNRGHGDRTAPPVGPAVEELPDILDAMSVATDQAGDEVIGEIAGDGKFASVEGGISQSIHARAGLDPERDEITAGAGDNDAGINDRVHAYSSR